MSDTSEPTISIPKPPPARVVSWAKTGDVVPVRNSLDVIENVLVLWPCESDQRLIYCLTHQLTLRNWGQLEMHVEVGGDHVLTRFCGRHAVPEGPEPTDVARSAAFNQLESGL